MTTPTPTATLAEMAGRVEMVRRYADSVKFHSRADCAELVPTRRTNICDCGLRITQAKLSFVVEILDDGFLPASTAFHVDPDTSIEVSSGQLWKLPNDQFALVLSLGSATAWAVISGAAGRWKRDLLTDAEITAGSLVVDLNDHAAEDQR